MTQRDKPQTTSSKKKEEDEKGEKDGDQSDNEDLEMPRSHSLPNMTWVEGADDDSLNDDDFSEDLDFENIKKNKQGIW